ncbi:hypothetical protein ACFUCQ_11030 [Streptomyces sp. NPDC057197]|uniref:hypothetical protein n=1 Tax=Streptomyces sp. NPDC057197 TaxID=3346045 RepID=UPI00362E94E1
MASLVPERTSQVSASQAVENPAIIAQTPAPQGGDGDELEPGPEDQREDVEDVVADVLGRQRDPAEGVTGTEDGELGDDVARARTRQAVRDTDRRRRTARLAGRITALLAPTEATAAEPSHSSRALAHTCPVPSRT